MDVKKKEEVTKKIIVPDVGHLIISSLEKYEVIDFNIDTFLKFVALIVEPTLLLSYI